MVAASIRKRNMSGADRRQYADAIERVPDHICKKDGGGDFDGEMEGIGDIDKRIDAGGAGEERRAYANDAEHGDPGRDAGPNELCADQWDGEHHQISEAVEDIGCIVEYREGLGCTDAGGGKNEQCSDENGGNENGVRWSAVARVKT